MKSMKSKIYSLAFALIIAYCADIHCQKNALDGSTTNYTGVSAAGNSKQKIDDEIINNIEFLSEYEMIESWDMLDNYEVLADTNVENNLKQ